MPRRSPKPSAEITAADRKARAIELRAAGHTFQQIAETLGYTHASAASKAYHAALRERPAQNVDQVRAAERERLEHMDATLAAIIANPPAKQPPSGKPSSTPTQARSSGTSRWSWPASGNADS